MLRMEGECDPTFLLLASCAQAVDPIFFKEHPNLLWPNSNTEIGRGGVKGMQVGMHAHIACTYPADFVAQDATSERVTSAADRTAH